MSNTPAERAPGGRVPVETSRTRVRVYLGGDVVADTEAPLLVWERPSYPTYYFPFADDADQERPRTQFS
jgi:uncharacterized protein (DUF427 family)